uniref:Cycloviolacin-O11 n=1 Tax=Viola odorata TaxID=97441 RepID=CYO11_VIOOD|nr:RecName: Full=Cycloviolacin-O11; AltName: Full=Cyclotide c2; Flags: Precursor [Viola odorata]AAU04392.1 cyclotide c2 precursor [Viola odorata]
MEMKNMVVGLFLIAAFALPALATSFEKDFITHETVQAILKKVGPSSNGMLDEQAISALTGKTIISNPVLEEALLTHSNSINALGGTLPCGESCVWIPCISAVVGCSCKSKVCYKNSLA